MNTTRTNHSTHASHTTTGMHSTRHTQLTIIVDSGLEQQITGDLTRFGASNWTTTRASSAITRMRAMSAMPTASTRIETIVPADVALEIVAYMRKRYPMDAGLMAYTIDIAVAAAGSYVAETLASKRQRFGEVVTVAPADMVHGIHATNGSHGTRETQDTHTLLPV